MNHLGILTYAIVSKIFEQPSDHAYYGEFVLDLHEMIEESYVQNILNTIDGQDKYGEYYATLGEYRSDSESIGIDNSNISPSNHNLILISSRKVARDLNALILIEWVNNRQVSFEKFIELLRFVIGNTL